MKTYIVANWKMNPSTLKEAIDLANSVQNGITETQNVTVVLCPPFTFIPQIILANNIQLGAQDCFWEQSTGAYTGEISPEMLQNLGCSYIILGHSEKKKYAGETYETINKKVKAVLHAKLTPVICIGEKERGNNEQELKTQILEVVKDLSPDEVKNIILAYEPEWAISSNENAVPATPDDCKNSIENMRNVLKETFGEIEIPILYGGSTNSKNIKSFIEAGADGALVGSASLDAAEFIQLVKNAL